ncbi:MAG: hypothetical protein LUQ50_07220, partial [Methanospirillum sp.]|uniref:hypothetical protein n=1 Tax=Methanospirillum sp. TaxID=45200 RepID=UPI00236C7EB3
MDPGDFTEKIPDDRSILVVSDVHLGGVEGPETINRMLNFLDKIESGTAKVVCHPEEHKDGSPPVTKTLLPPTKIILLG